MARAHVAVAMLACGVTAAAAPVLTALARIEPGEWQIKPIGSTTGGRTLCVSDPAAILVQYGHAVARCQRSIITNDGDVSTIGYACAGIGHGQTSIKVATPRSFNLDTQGILRGAPFDEQYEARRIGACNAR